MTAPIDPSQAELYAWIHDAWNRGMKSPTHLGHAVGLSSARITQILEDLQLHQRRVPYEEALLMMGSDMLRRLKVLNQRRQAKC